MLDYEKAWKALIKLAGHLHDGSQQTVKLVQDDATRTAIIVAGKRSYYRDGCGFEAAIEEAMKDVDQLG